jgi:calpain-7
MSRIPTNHSPKNRAIYALLQEKIVHYEKVASALLSQPTELSPTNKNSNDASSNNLALSQLSIQGGRIGNNDHARSPLSNFDFPTSNWSDPSPPKLLEQRNPKNSSRSSNSKSPADLDKREIQYRNQQAILALSQAIDDDERMINNITKHGTKNKPCIGNAADVITKYMEAAEHFLEAMQKLRNMKSCNNDENNSDQIDAVMKQRLQQILDRVEILKLQQHPRHNFSEAYVSASYQQLEQNTTTTSTKDATLTAEEVQVLKQSSFIASGSFLPWSDGDATRFNTECCEQRNQNRLTTSFSNLFTDPAGFLTLSTRQKEHFYAWARPNEIIRIRQQHNNILSSLKLRGFSGATSSATSDGDNNIVAMRPSSISPYTIQQKYITECSFIASLCTCANYERKFHKPLVSSILYPQAKDIKSGKLQPMYNPNGKYMVKLWLNGSPRCVIVDDYLPIDKHGNILCSQATSCTTSNNKLELWVCLIEKAYMKLCGGYNFPGSNSGVTLFAITGWIPEQICFTLHNSLQKDRAASAADVSENITSDEEMSYERVWERIYSASSFGDCLITISTISNSRGNEETMSTVGLISGHSYAVLSVVQTTNGARLLKLKNPWAQQGWKGRYSCFDNHGWRSSKLRNELGYDPTLAKNQDDGVFWICWDDILHYFQDFYLLWNPKLFSKRHVLHGHWSENQGPTDDTFNIGENPQYVVTLSDQAVSKKSTLWILISRHVTKQEHEGEEVCVTFYVDCLTQNILSSFIYLER